MNHVQCGDEGLGDAFGEGVGFGLEVDAFPARRSVMRVAFVT
ncbi:MAG: hypothetical protein RLZ83_772, partial [Pseudomonadota bacterium]